MQANGCMQQISLRALNPLIHDEQHIHVVDEALIDL